MLAIESYFRRLVGKKPNKNNELPVKAELSKGAILRGRGRALSNCASPVFGQSFKGAPDELVLASRSGEARMG
ncbi:MAG: hypothetical protein U0521_19705 [Anaerolineae bacterium]